MPAKCFGCGADGYIESECPYCRAAAADTRPPWCGICDQRTRQLWLTSDGTSVQRCPRCHPASRKPLAQHRRCPECKTITYSWDSNPCGSHLAPAAPDKRLPIERIREITGSNS